MIAPDGPFFAR